MSTIAQIRCDACNRAEEAAGATERGWGTLTILHRGTRDVCPRCISQVLGWKGAA
jgi:hypothetical protein